MQQELTIRTAIIEDIPYLKKVLDSIDLFPSSMLENMISDYLENPNTEDIWITALEEDTPIAIAFCGPEQLTNGTYNLFAIGIEKSMQGKGIGKKVMAFIENLLVQKGKRLLIVDTSGTSEFELTRKFYEQIGYTKEAIIRDFWDKGDDKVVYRKSLKKSI